jgi:hypothetical protein
MLINVYTIYTGPRSVQAQYSRLCPISSSFHYNDSLVTWTVVCLTATKFKPLILSMSGFALSNIAILDPRYISSERIPQKIWFHNNYSIVIEECLPLRWIETAVLLLLRVYFRMKLFTESFPSNDHLLWLRYSGFQASCHSIKQISKCFWIKVQILNLLTDSKLCN